MYVVCVRFEIVDGKMIEFLPLMHQQAENSLALESECHQFDVCTDRERPNEVFLYELYTDRSAFDAHLESEHFRTFDAQVTALVVAKTVDTWSVRYNGKH